MTFYRSKEDSSYAGYHLSYEVKKLMYASISQSSALSIDFVSFALSFGMNVVLYLFDISVFSLFSIGLRFVRNLYFSLLT